MLLHNSIFQLFCRPVIAFKLFTVDRFSAVIVLNDFFIYSWEKAIIALNFSSN